MSTPTILLIESPDGLGAHEADAALRTRAMRRAGLSARHIVVEPEDGRSRADVASALFARAGDERICEAWIASGFAGFRAIEQALPAGTPCRWWPTLVPGCGGEPGTAVAGSALLAPGADGRHAAFELAPVRAGRERAPVTLWDGEFVLAPGPLLGAEGERLLEAFAAAAEERPALDLVVLCDPDAALLDAARRLGVGWRVHCAGVSPREAEHTWIATAAALLLPASQPLAAGLVLRLLAAGAPVVVDAASPQARSLVEWFGGAGLTLGAPAAEALEAALVHAPRARAARETGRTLAARHEPDALATRIAAAVTRREAPGEREAA